MNELHSPGVSLEHRAGHLEVKGQVNNIWPAGPQTSLSHTRPMKFTVGLGLKEISINYNMLFIWRLPCSCACACVCLSVACEVKKCQVNVSEVDQWETERAQSTDWRHSKKVSLWLAVSVITEQVQLRFMEVCKKTNSSQWNPIQKKVSTQLLCEREGNYSERGMETIQ